MIQLLKMKSEEMVFHAVSKQLLQNMSRSVSFIY